jgi:hypothetical protein
MPTIGVLGVQAKWKGLFEAIAISKLYNNKPIRWIFAGPLDMSQADIKRMDLEIASAREAGATIDTYFHRIPEGQVYNTLMNQCDIVWAAYPQHVHSSNSMVKAAFLRKPVLVCKPGLMAERCEMYGLGRVSSPDLQSLYANLRSLIDSSYRVDPEGRLAFLSQHNESAIERASDFILSRESA